MTITLKFDEHANSDVALQVELDPPPKFKKIDEAHDWALMNLPRGLLIEMYDGRGHLRAWGTVGGEIRKQ